MSYSITFSLPCQNIFRLVTSKFVRQMKQWDWKQILHSVIWTFAAQFATTVHVRRIAVFLCGFHWLTANWQINKAVHIQLTVSVGYVNPVSFNDNVEFNELFYPLERVRLNNWSFQSECSRGGTKYKSKINNKVNEESKVIKCFIYF